MICKNCGKKIIVDLENDLIHEHLNEKGVDPRFCDGVSNNMIATKTILLNEINGTVIDKNFDTVEVMEKYIVDWLFNAGLIEWSIEKCHEIKQKLSKKCSNCGTWNKFDRTNCLECDVSLEEIK